jgi:hypothetical protein
LGSIRTKRDRGKRLAFEPLEGRLVLAAISLVGTGDSALVADGVTKIDIVDPDNDSVIDTGEWGTAPTVVSLTGGNFNGPGNNGEHAGKVFDNGVSSQPWGSSTSKVCCSFSPGTSSITVTSSTSQYSLTGYTITTGNDSPGRRPDGWRLFGSNDAFGTAGVLLDTVVANDINGGLGWTTNLQVGEAVLAAPTAAYSSFRFVFDDSVTPNQFQVQEIELIGNQGLGVVSSLPADGDVLATAPATATINFTQDYDVASVEPGDLTVDGVPATGFTLIDADTIEFTLPVLGTGTHTMNIADGVIDADDGNLESVQPFAATFTIPVTASVINSPATDITAFAAGIGAEVINTGGQAPDLYMYWGDNDGGTTVGAWDDVIPLGSVDVGTVPTGLSGLTEGTPYYYRVRADNLAGSQWAPSTASFVTDTLSAATLTTEEADLVGAFAARVSGEVTDTGGDAPEVTIHYGTTDGGTTAGAWDASIVIGDRVDSFSTTISGLNTETTYFFRAHASNAFGESWSPVTRSFMTTESPELQITEFMAKNDNGLTTSIRETVGGPLGGLMTPDWIEIYNVTTETVSLGGAHLTDSQGNPSKWTFPAGTDLAGQSYLIIIASNENITDPALDEHGYLHTNFSLDAGGEFLALTSGTGAIIDQYDFPAQVSDISYGDFGGQRRYFVTPTPGDPNSPDFTDIVADTKFSVDRGFFNAPFNLEITTDTPDATIRYTLDGSPPSDTHGTIFNGSIPISVTSTIRAIAFKTGFQPTDIDTHTYIFVADVAQQDYQATLDAGFPSSWNGTSPDYGIDPNAVGPEFLASLTALPTLSIVSEIDGLFGSNGIYSNPGSHTLEVATSFELIDPSGGDEFQVNAGLKIQGGAFRSMGLTKKNSFRLKFQSQYGPSKLRFPFFGEDATDEFDTITLRMESNDGWQWNGNETDRVNRLYARDEFGRRTQLAMGEPSSHGNRMHLYINGIYWGIYNPVERPDDSFAEQYIEGDRDDWDIQNSGSWVDGDGAAWNTMLSLAQDVADQANGSAEQLAAWHKLQGSNPDGTNNPAWENFLDVDNLINYMIVNHYGGNSDWAHKNYYAGRLRGPESTGFKFFMWDSEWSLNLRSNVATNKTNDFRGVAKPYELLMDVPEFQARFADLLHEHFFNGGVLYVDQSNPAWDSDHPERNLPAARFVEVTDEVAPGLAGESARWGDQHGALLTIDDWRQTVDGLLGIAGGGSNSAMAYFALRSMNVMEDYRQADLYSDLDAPEFKIGGARQHGGIAAGGAGVTFCTESFFTGVCTDFPSGGGSTLYYTTDGTDPRLVGGAVAAGVQTFGVSIPLNSTTEITARIYIAGNWSAVSTATFYVDAPRAGDLSITEINYSPYEPDSGSPYDREQFEFIELRNTSTKTIDLTGTALSGAVTYEFVGSASTLLAPNDFVLVVRNRGAFEDRYGELFGGVIAGEFANDTQLNNGGETVLLTNPDGEVLHNFTYDNSGSWPERADGKGSTLEVIDTTGDYNDSDNWRSSAEYNGSPGAAGIGPDNRIVVSEVLSHTDAPLVDSIELYNTTDSTIDVSGWYLSDSKNDFQKFQIPEGTNILAEGYLVFDENDFNVSLGVDPNDFALDGAHGDDVYLLSVDEEGEPHRFVEHAEFVAAFNGVTLGRWPDENGDLIPMRWRTLGADNSTPMLPELVISEIHYNPAHATPRAWTKQAGNWKITGGHLESFGDPSGTVNYLATVDAEQTDVTVDVTVYFPEELNDAPDYGLFDMDASGIIGRYNSSFDFLVVGIRQFSSEVGVWKYAGIWTEVVPPVAIPGGVVTGDDYRLSATFDGTMITVAVDGAQLISENVPINTTGTQFGVRALSEGDQFDDFLITPIADEPLTTDSFSRDSTSGLGTTDELGNDLEFVEIYNPTGETIDLTGWRLRKGVDYDFVEPGTSAVSLDAGDTIVVLSFDPADPLNADRTGQFRSGHGIDASVVLVGPYSGKLSNKGEAIELQRPDTSPFLEPDFTPHVFNDRVKYGVVSPWPEVLRSFDSLNRVTPSSFGQEAMSWVASVPTPGSVSFAPIVAELLGVGSNGNQPSHADAVTAVAAGLTQIDIYLDARLSETDDIKAEQVRFVDGVEVIDDPDVDIDVEYDDDDSATLSITFDAVVNAWIRVTLPASMPEISADLITYVGSLRGDIDGSGKVGVGDLAALFVPSIPSDLTGDGRVGAADLATVLASWGTVLEGVPTGDPAMGDSASGDAAAGVVDAAIVQLTAEPAAIGPLPTFIAQPISSEQTSPQRIRRAVTGPVIEGELTHTVRRRRSRIATDVALDDAAVSETGPLIRSAGRRR